MKKELVDPKLVLKHLKLFFCSEKSSTEISMYQCNSTILFICAMHLVVLRFTLSLLTLKLPTVVQITTIAAVIFIIIWFILLLFFVYLERFCDSSIDDYKRAHLTTKLQYEDDFGKNIAIIFPCCLYMSPVFETLSLWNKIVSLNIFLLGKSEDLSGIFVSNVDTDEIQQNSNRSVFNHRKLSEFFS